MVELHGGTVRAESAGEGQGATFTVTLPLAGEIAKAAARADRRAGCRAATAARRCSGMRVLVVEDDPETRDMLAAILDRSGFSYRVASARQRSPERAR